MEVVKYPLYISHYFRFNFLSLGVNGNACKYEQINNYNCDNN